MSEEQNDILDVWKYFEKQQLRQAKLTGIWNSRSLHSAFEEILKKELDEVYSKSENRKLFMGDKSLCAELLLKHLDSDNHILKTQTKLFWQRHSKFYEYSWKGMIDEYFDSLSESEIIRHLVGDELNTDTEKLLEQRKTKTDTIILYCESTICHHENGRFDYKLDFFSSEDILTKARELFPEGGGRLSERVQQASMIRLNNVSSQDNKYMREGSWYEIPIADLHQLVTFEIPQEQNHTLLVGNSRDFPEMKFMDFAQYIKKVPLLIDPREYLIDGQSISSNFSKKATSLIGNFKVYDVGCGSCSELTTISKPIKRIFFDFGADSDYISPIQNSSSGNTTKKIIDRLSLNNSVSIILSHWDEDHVRLFIDINNYKSELLNNIETIIAPALIPDTKTNEKILNIIENKILIRNNTHFCLVAIPPRRSKKLDSIGFFNGIEIYAAALPPERNVNLDQNNRGIVALVEGKHKVALLPGDHSYPHLQKSIIKPNLKNGKVLDKPLEFVIPHHGGRAGRRENNSWKSLTYSATILSTRDGAYKNLPRKEHFEAFSSLGNFHCTDDNCRYLSQQSCKSCYKTNCVATKKNGTVYCQQTTFNLKKACPNSPAIDYQTML